MYCSTCGAFLAEGLVYCSRCGARASSGASAAAAVSRAPEGPSKLPEVILYLTAATGGVALGGLLLVFVIALSLLKRGMDTSAIMLMVLMGLALVAVISVMLIRLLTRSLNAYLQTGAGDEARKPELAHRDAPAQIEEPRQTPLSVTENTTRSFDPLYKENRG
ncbi:MAG TPA: hypothetical protein VM934_00095 [Pyrinomonadaceae bacterium]|jgi:hypothetical protein|nr:hypothetical protein [Pyrinomonadaceae bacterium]